MATILLMLIVVHAVMFFLHKSLTKGIEMEDGIRTKHFRVITRMVVVIIVCLLAHDITGDHGPAMSRIFVAFLLILVVTSSSSPDL